jgi:Icc protein
VKNFTLRFSITLIFLFLLNFSAFAQKKKDDFSFVFITDTHIKYDSSIINSYRKVVKQINKFNPDFVLSGGDQVFDVMRGGEQMADSLFTLFKKESSAIKAPVYTTVGNHELFGIYEESITDSTHHYYKYGIYEKYFGKTYYSFDHKGWHFVVLNDLDVKNKKYISSFDSAQLDWLKQDLSTLTKETPLVIMLHIPLVSVQNQFNVPEGGLIQQTTAVNRAQLLNILEPYNLKLVLQGHLHYFEDIMVNGKTRFITGGAVAGRPSWRGVKNGPRGFLQFKVKAGKLKYSFIDYENNKALTF